MPKSILLFETWDSPDMVIIQRIWLIHLQLLWKWLTWYRWDPFKKPIVICILFTYSNRLSGQLLWKYVSNFIVLSARFLCWELSCFGDNAFKRENEEMSIFYKQLAEPLKMLCILAVNWFLVLPNCKSSNIKDDYINCR